MCPGAYYMYQRNCDFICFFYKFRWYTLLVEFSITSFPIWKFLFWTECDIFQVTAAINICDPFDSVPGRGCLIRKQKKIDFAQGFIDHFR